MLDRLTTLAGKVRVRNKDKVWLLCFDSLKHVILFPALFIDQIIKGCRGLNESSEMR